MGTSSQLGVVILAAGKGTRMKSESPKALLEICGQPMLWHLLEKTKRFRPQNTVVVAGYKIEQVRDFVQKTARMVHQKEQLGSGHALLQTREAFKVFKGQILVLYCDTPALSYETLKKLLDQHGKTGADGTLLSVKVDKPFGYGRVVRGIQGSVEKIVEENDASTEEKEIKEINVGAYIFKAPVIFQALEKIKENALKKEYYLTDTIKILSEQGRVEAVVLSKAEEAMGVNSRQELLEMGPVVMQQILQRLAGEGVEIRDARTTYIEADVKIGKGTVILPCTVIEKGCVIGSNCMIGPFARIRGGSVIEDGAIIGNFVEVVRSRIGKKAQVKHLSYLGDTTVGEEANIGAGSITANFDGKKKHKTVIGRKASIGSGTVLVAPVKVGPGAKTGAGAVVTRGEVKASDTVVGVPAKSIRRKS